MYLCSGFVRTNFSLLFVQIKKRSHIKIFEMLLQVLAFKEAIYILSVIIGKQTFPFGGFFENFIPNNYYVMLYLALYYISPYINLVFEKLSVDEWNKFLKVMLVLFSIYPVAVYLSREILGVSWFGPSTIGAWGNQQGFTITNFVLVYCIGGYLRYVGFPKIYYKRKNTFFIILSVVCVIFGWSCMNELLQKNGLRSAWVYYNPFVILLAVSLFIFFSKMNMKSGIINELAKASFSCFLVHGAVLGFFDIKEAVKQPSTIMLLHVIVVVVCAYICSYFIFQIYDMLSKPILGFFYKLIKLEKRY